MNNKTEQQIIDHIREKAESFDFEKVDEHYVPQPRTWAEVERKWSKMGIKVNHQSNSSDRCLEVDSLAWRINDLGKEVQEYFNTIHKIKAICERDIDALEKNFLIEKIVEKFK